MLKCFFSLISYLMRPVWTKSLSLRTQPYFTEIFFGLSYKDQSLREVRNDLGQSRLDFREDLGLHVKYHLFLPGFNENWEVSTDSD